ncbi:MAG: UDP-N-acetylmuramoyl-L-alanyl-D-glutamate--2,6-diaminopimelate ligase [Candidatus Schekmanbacteria bacterium RBG_16_38_11]|uniref:UDP-N-acetylmuramoyl-L-alanyl-D-glutamate--2,6-diaminopimelate ligase n=1 Tax=Candidatus Schekmanbacteria bacterium RBG_16_38_11 TaxID=1817880 RepID=A0A1F7RYY1_9BACT|nr:MAG: UDP-N-acetylmuramoyl-L-alanyl-D-glutamate--2,6-diaminopimelate ligase [Candidatus Schekmanbacteria bacterium RBG_16_38_11]
MLLNKLLEILPEKKISGETDLNISSIEYDSRKIKDGSLFVAIRGLKDDGYKFIGDALIRGAKAIVVNEGLFDAKAYRQNKPFTAIEVKDSRSDLALLANKFYDFPSRSLKLIGITGTNGKTTTSYLIESILKEDGKKTGLIGTINYRIGDEVLPALRTTPESSDLQKILKDMVSAGCGFAIIEVSSHSLELNRVDGCYFTGAIFTNLTKEHLDFHKNMKNYLSAKKKLFQGLKNMNGSDTTTFAVINADDPVAGEIIAATGVRIATYGLKVKADISAADFKSDFSGTRGRVIFPDGEIDISSPLAGGFNIYNILAAAAASYCLGIRKEKIVEGIAAMKSVPGRFQMVEWNGDFEIIVDYAHTPDALERCLSQAKNISRGKLITVFGCGGDRDKGKRPEMGRIGAELSDVLYITSDNPRSEDPVKIIEDIKAGIKGKEIKEKVKIIPDRREAIYGALEIAQTGDLIVIAGKGHEDYQIIGNKIIHFDDKEVVLEKLKKMGKA